MDRRVNKTKIVIENSLIKLKYASTLASSAQLGIIQKWSISGMEETPEEMAYFVSEVIYNLYNNVIVSFNLNK